MFEYYVEDLRKCFDEIKQINYFKNGEKKEIKIKTINKLKIKSCFSFILNNAQVLPSLGVSLHEETKKELQTGEWIEILFNDEQSFEGMTFEGLLFKLEKTTGLNLIRVVDGKYEGRNFYLMLDDELNLFKLFNSFN